MLQVSSSPYRLSLSYSQERHKDTRFFLHYCIWLRPSEEKVFEVYAENAAVPDPGNRGVTPLILAAIKGSAKALYILLRTVPNACWVSDYREYNCCHHAAIAGTLATVRSVFQKLTEEEIYEENPFPFLMYEPNNRDATPEGFRRMLQKPQKQVWPTFLVEKEDQKNSIIHLPTAKKFWEKLGGMNYCEQFFTDPATLRALWKTSPTEEETRCRMENLQEIPFFAVQPFFDSKRGVYLVAKEQIEEGRCLYFYGTLKRGNCSIPTWQERRFLRPWGCESEEAFYVEAFTRRSFAALISSGVPNGEFCTVNHPLYGLVPAFKTTRAVSPGEPLRAVWDVARSWGHFFLSKEEWQEIDAMDWENMQFSAEGVVVKESVGTVEPSLLLFANVLFYLLLNKRLNRKGLLAFLMRAYAKMHDLDEKILVKNFITKTLPAILKKREEKKFLYLLQKGSITVKSFAWITSFSQVSSLTWQQLEEIGICFGLIPELVRGAPFDAAFFDKPSQVTKEECEKKQKQLHEQIFLGEQSLLKVILSNLLLLEEMKNFSRNMSQEAKSALDELQKEILLFLTSTKEPSNEEAPD